MPEARNPSASPPERRRPEPLVSVAVTTRNRAESLERALRALGELTYPRYEVIVVDNGSTDATARVAERFPVRYVVSPVSDGISGARQRGVEAARGEIVAMCDDDCVPRPDWLEAYVERFLAEDELGLLGGHVNNIGFPGARQFKGRTKLGRNGELRFVVDPVEADYFGNLNMAVRVEALRSFGGYDPFFKAGREEIDLAQSVRRAGYRVAYEPRAVVEHYFTGINYKRGRLFFDQYLMRLYFFFKHFRPRSPRGWWSFATYESRLFGRELLRAAKALGAAVVRLRPARLPAIALDFVNLTAARAAIPWLLWRTRKGR